MHSWKDTHICCTCLVVYIRMIAFVAILPLTSLSLPSVSRETAIALLGHRNWIEAMQHRTCEAGRITTPMRRMIEKLPSKF